MVLTRQQRGTGVDGGAVAHGPATVASVGNHSGGKEVAKRNDNNEAKVVTRLRQRGTATIVRGDEEGSGGYGLHGGKAILAMLRGREVKHQVELHAANPKGPMMSTDTHWKLRNLAVAGVKRETRDLRLR